MSAYPEGPPTLVGRWRSTPWWDVRGLVGSSLYEGEGPDSGRAHPDALDQPVEWAVPVLHDVALAKRDEMFVPELDVVAYATLGLVTKRPVTISWLEMLYDEFRFCDVPTHRSMGGLVVAYVDTVGGRVYVASAAVSTVFAIGMDVVTEMSIEPFEPEHCGPDGETGVDRTRCRDGAQCGQHYKARLVREGRLAGLLRERLADTPDPE